MIAGLAARIPHKVAMEMMLLGEPIDAARAYAVGLANPRRAGGKRGRGGDGDGRKDRRPGAAGAGGDKRFVNDGVLPKGPAELMARYAAELGAVRNSEDAAEGVRAFREKRRPRYQGTIGGRAEAGTGSSPKIARGGEELVAFGFFEAGGFLGGVVSSRKALAVRLGNRGGVGTAQAVGAARDAPSCA